ncbi:MAG: hypothetical protein V4529_16510 [Gemmatimonadota bacterium]
MSRRWFQKQVERCVSSLEQAYFTNQNGIEFCSRCGFARGLHESVKAQQTKAEQARKAGA